MHARKGISTIERDKTNHIIHEKYILCITLAIYGIFILFYVK